MATSPRGHLLNRYSRQARFAPLGDDGQRAIQAGSVAIVGCGALGSVAADLLARAGVARLSLVDRDVVDLSNLHRVALLDETDVAEGLPKSVAVARHLGRIRPDLDCRPIVADLDGMNATDLLAGHDIILDGSDNFEARHVLNEASLDLRLPWVHAAVLGAQALVWPIVPGKACYSCQVPDAPAPGEVETCETAGVLGPAVHVAASLQVAAVMKILAGADTGQGSGTAPDVAWSVDCWQGTSARVSMQQDPECPACRRGERRWLGQARAADTVACGRGAVQVLARPGAAPDLERLHERLADLDGVRLNAFVLRFRADGHDLTIFRDGRVLVGGTRDAARARSIAARYLG